MLSDYYYNAFYPLSQCFIVTIAMLYYYLQQCSMTTKA